MDTVVTEKKGTPPNRRRLMTAFTDAVEFIRGFREVPFSEGREAIKLLLEARDTMERHTTMQNFGVYPFFRFLTLSPEQTEYLLQSLVRERITMCAQLLAGDTNILERILESDTGTEKIPYPLALQALHFAYQHFQETMMEGEHDVDSASP